MPGDERLQLFDRGSVGLRGRVGRRLGLPLRPRLRLLRGRGRRGLHDGRLVVGSTHPQHRNADRVTQLAEDAALDSILEARQYLLEIIPHAVSEQLRLGRLRAVLNDRGRMRAYEPCRAIDDGIDDRLTRRCARNSQDFFFIVHRLSRVLSVTFALRASALTHEDARQIDLGY